MKTIKTIEQARKLLQSRIVFIDEVDYSGFCITIDGEVYLFDHYFDTEEEEDE